jgi:hypothetical protein
VEEGQIIYLSDEANMEDDKLTVGCTVTGIAEQLNWGKLFYLMMD